MNQPNISMKTFLIILPFLFYTSCFGQVTLNEMQSSNNSTISDNLGEFDDWVEIHNPTTDTIEIGGLVLKDQLDTWMIPTGNPATLIPPNGYFLLWADDQESQGIFHTNFKLASGGEFLGLYANDSITVIDSITIPALSPNESYIRCLSDWIQTNAPTPTSENDCTASVDENTNFSDLFSIQTTNHKQLEINIIGNLKNQAFLSIYSLEGKELVKQVLTDKTTILPLNSLKSSIYLISITTNDNVYSKKVAF